MLTLCLALQSPAYLRAANANDGDDNNDKCQHLMFDDRFFPVAIFVTVRPLSSPAREQSHGVSHMETLSKQLIWFSTEHRDCKFIVFLSAAADVGAFHHSDQPLKEFLISSLIISLLSVVSSTPVKCKYKYNNNSGPQLKGCILSAHTPLYVQYMPAADDEPLQPVIFGPYLTGCFLCTCSTQLQECVQSHIYTRTHLLSLALCSVELL